MQVPLYYCRDHDLKAINVLIVQDGTAYHVKIKKNKPTRAKYCAVFFSA
jgi:hypothetical protein